MTNAPQQIVLWTTEFINDAAAHWDSIRVILAFGLIVYLAVMLYNRFEDDADPSVRYQAESATGTMSILISGAMLTALVLFVLTFLIWPLPVEMPAVGAMMVGVFVAHYYLEKQEVGS